MVSVPERSAGVVLLAEDEALVRALGERVLADAGFAVRSVTNGREAVEAFHSGQHDIRVVVLDVTMPELGGIEVLAEIRRTSPLMPVLLTSGVDQSDAAGPWVADARVAFLHKPYTLDALVGSVRTLADASFTNADAAPSG